MDFIGEYIRKKRISKKLTLDTVSKELKISKNILKKIEDDELDNYINKVFFLGHLRSYANFLNLNTNEIVKTFKIQNSYESAEIFNQIPKPIIQNTFFKFNRLLSITLIFLIFITFYFLFIDVEKTSPEYAIIPDIPEILGPVFEKELIDLEIRETKKNNQKILNPTIKQDITFTSANASLNIDDDAFINQTVTLKFLNPTWLQLRNFNDEIVLSQLMNKNDEYIYDLNLNYSLTAGNAGNILILIDNEIRGKIGDLGEVVDSIVIDSNFSN